MNETEDENMNIKTVILKPLLCGMMKEHTARKFILK